MIRTGKGSYDIVVAQNCSLLSNNFEPYLNYFEHSILGGYFDTTLFKTGDGKNLGAGEQVPEMA
jgi:hypothetical protein